jgi:hypothetical protein
LRAILIFTDVLSHGVAQLAKIGGQLCGGMFLVMGELRIAMKILVGLDQAGQLSIYRLKKRRGLLRDRDTGER